MTLPPLPTLEDVKKFDGEVNSFGFIPKSFDRVDVAEVLSSFGLKIPGTF